MHQEGSLNSPILPSSPPRCWLSLREDGHRGEGCGDFLSHGPDGAWGRTAASPTQPSKGLVLWADMQRAREPGSQSRTGEWGRGMNGLAGHTQRQPKELAALLGNGWPSLGASCPPSVPTGLELSPNHREVSVHCALCKAKPRVSTHHDRPGYRPATRPDLPDPSSPMGNPQLQSPRPCRHDLDTVPLTSVNLLFGAELYPPCPRAAG